jgi:hypothetical protein
MTARLALRQQEGARQAFADPLVSGRTRSPCCSTCRIDRSDYGSAPHQATSPGARQAGLEQDLVGVCISDASKGVPVQLRIRHPRRGLQGTELREHQRMTGLRNNQPSGPVERFSQPYRQPRHA